MVKITLWKIHQLNKTACYKAHIVFHSAHPIPCKHNYFNTYLFTHAHSSQYGVQVTGTGEGTTNVKNLCSDRISFLEYFVCYFWTQRTWLVFIDRLNECTSYAKLFCLPCRALIPNGQAYQGKWNCYFDFLLRLKAKNKTIFHSICPVLRASEEVWVVIMFPRVLSQQAFAPLK